MCACVCVCVHHTGPNFSIMLTVFAYYKYVRGCWLELIYNCVGLDTVLCFAHASRLTRLFSVGLPLYALPFSIPYLYCSKANFSELGFWSIGTATILCIYGCVLLLLLERVSTWVVVVVAQPDCLPMLVRMPQA